MVMEKRFFFYGRYQIMMTRLDMTNAKLNVYSRTEVISCNAVNTKSPISHDADLNAQSKPKRKVIAFVNYIFHLIFNSFN